MNHPVRILLVEDSPQDAELVIAEVQQTLPDAVIQVVDAEKDYVQALDSFQPDIILSDYRLPQFDGMKALRIAQSKVPDTPLILVTGSMNEETAVACMKAGAADYIIKEHLRRVGPAILNCLAQREKHQQAKQTDEALQRQERHYRLLFETAPVGILSALPDGRITSVNPEALRILGSPSAEATMSINLLNFPLLIQFGLADEFRKAVEKRQRAEGEKPYITKWGKPIHIYYQVSPIFDNNGELESLQVIFQDVTQLRRAENEQKEFSEKLIKLIDFTNQLTFAQTTDEVYRRSVEFIIGELHIDRVAFWILDDKNKRCLGTWGVDETGRLRDERKAVVNFIPKDVMKLLEAKKPSIIVEEADLQNEKGQVVGHGQHIVAGLFDGERMAGFLSADNLLSKRSFTESDLQLLTLAATSVGHLAALKELETKLRESLRQWKQTFDAIQDGIALLDADHRILQSNEAFCRFAKQSADELYGQFCYRFVHQTDSPVPNCPFELAKSSLRREKMEMEINGLICEVMVDPLIDESGKMIGSVHIVSDITQRKQAERERERLLTTAEQSRRALLNVIEDQKLTEAALRTSEEKYRGIFENIQDVYFECDLEGNLLEISPSIAVLSKGYYTREELIGRSLFDFTEGDILYIFRDLLLKGGQIADLEILLRNKDGSLIPCAVTVAVRIDTVTGAKKIVGSVRDITERKKAEELLRRELEIKRRLLQELYHRTKNNMQVIISMLRVNASRIKALPQEIKEMLGNIEIKIHAMALVHQKLYQAQDLSHVNLGEYFRDLIDLLKRSHPVFQTVKIHEELEDVKVLMDTAMPLGMVLSELITNMIKHAWPDGRPGEMRLKLKKSPQNELILEVADNGVGFPPGFDYRRDAGVGLDTIIGQIEHQLDGEIYFENRNGLYCRIVLKRELYWERV
ncbi:MAG: PAS domain S-box protein [candidate division KSB1 bacterium]|nr:PAS domain S-box protein [candidate division KSB1 bacterium]